jgi:Uma2 family endonuclease
MTDAAVRFTEPFEKPLPDHTQLPDSDGTFVKNFQEHPQSILLTDSIEPVLAQIHPDGNYAIGQDCGIYWRQTDPPEKGAEAPDWFYVPDVPPLLNGEIRRSYVLWKEYIAPLIAIEFASGDGREERDRTPLLRTDQGAMTKPGKFWVYERIIRIPYYAIYEISKGYLEVYHSVDGSYQPLAANEQGRYPIGPLGVELGVWTGTYLGQGQSWLRWWDSQGDMLLTGRETVAQEREIAAQEREIAAQAIELAQTERNRADQLAQQLRALGIEPNTP